MNETIQYGLCELARELGLPESTTRYYRDVFAPFVPSIGRGRKRRYPAEAVERLRFIADAFAEGRTREEISKVLSKGGTTEPREDDVDNGPQHVRSDQLVTSMLDGEREQRELMWQMIRELSRFGDAIERQHYILSELVDRVFHSSERKLMPASDSAVPDEVVDAEVISASDDDDTCASERTRTASQPDLEALRQALETERSLVERLRQSKLELERRAAAAEAELEQLQEQEPSLLRRIFERNRGL